ncbi:metal-dependent hydrolase [Arsenophonus endosymbiont of Bemisia tabaci]|uniref:metal-dependent hydrolase n=1 Tax=Arsenophonus endosymbiont of Bemisia tabaci TaxID=536059 RepID=UPI0015F47115|nr:metal-dependent hydrolase [Arsenophonus endosymbiont of Bemisia tabaci]CAA2930555.1 Inner membrane protein YdjM [Arsenophonus endosymbiont of Bemisia tabaci Q2]
MTAGGHFIFALASAIFVKKLELSAELAQGNWWHIIIGGIGGILTCLLPDIDHPKSFFCQRLNWLSIPIAKVFGHRVITHSFLAIVGCSIFFSSDLLSRIIIRIPVDFVHAMVVGYISHVVADMLTPAGIPLLWPYRRRFCMPTLNPTKYPKWERIFCVLVLVCAVLYPFDILISNKLWVTDFIQNIWKLACNNFI